MKLDYIYNQLQGNEEIEGYKSLLCIVENLMDKVFIDKPYAKFSHIRHMGDYKIYTPFGSINRSLLRSITNKGEFKDASINDKYVKNDIKFNNNQYKDGTEVTQSGNNSITIKDYENYLLVRERRYYKGDLSVDKAYKYNTNGNLTFERYDDYNNLGELNYTNITSISYDDKNIYKEMKTSTIFGYPYENTLCEYIKVGDGLFKDFYECRKYSKEDGESEYVKESYRNRSYLYFLDNDVNNYIEVVCFRNKIEVIKIHYADTSIEIDEVFDIVS